MPVEVKNKSRHRVKIPKQPLFPFAACVARPVNKAEIAKTPKAQEAMQKEWDRLTSKGVWDENDVEEWDDVRRRYNSINKKVHLGYLFGICVQKNHELRDDDPAKKFKGRVVFQGNRVVDQFFDAAIFQDQGSAPATLEAARNL